MLQRQPFFTVTLCGAGSSFLSPSLQVLARSPKWQIIAGPTLLMDLAPWKAPEEPRQKRDFLPQELCGGARAPSAGYALPAGSLPPHRSHWAQHFVPSTAAQALHYYTLHVIMFRMKKGIFLRIVFTFLPLLFPSFSYKFINFSFSLNLTERDFQKHCIFKWVLEKSLIQKNTNKSLICFASTVRKISINPAITQIQSFYNLKSLLKSKGCFTAHYQHY